MRAASVADNIMQLDTDPKIIKWLEFVLKKFEDNVETIDTTLKQLKKDLKEVNLELSQALNDTNPRIQNQKS